MNRSLLVLGLLAALSACGDGQPFPFDGDGGGGAGPDLPPGTEEPTAGSSISRREEVNAQGGGYVEAITYDREADTFAVDGIAFDGDNVYTREDNRAVRTLSNPGGEASYRVYEAAAEVPDDATGVDVDQFQYRAILGESSTRDGDGNPVTRFAIVRTGSYVDYGFGGFVYERNGGVDLPTEGQATYSGEYAGMRVLSGAASGGGQDLTYVTGRADIDIDFEDFNEGSGVKGVISGRAYTDTEGNPVTGLPAANLVFEVGPGTVSESGEISSGVGSIIDGELYEQGTYYAIVAGENADEIVGIVVVESDDLRFEDVTAQETGGFIVYR